MNNSRRLDDVIAGLLDETRVRRPNTFHVDRALFGHWVAQCDHGHFGVLARVVLDELQDAWKAAIFRSGCLRVGHHNLSVRVLEAEEALDESDSSGAWSDKVQSLLESEQVLRVVRVAYQETAFASSTLSSTLFPAQQWAE